MHDEIALLHSSRAEHHTRVSLWLELKKSAWQDELKMKYGVVIRCLFLQGLSMAVHVQALPVHLAAFLSTIKPNRAMSIQLMEQLMGLNTTLPLTRVARGDPITRAPPTAATRLRVLMRYALAHSVMHFNPAFIFVLHRNRCCHDTTSGLPGIGTGPEMLLSSSLSSMHSWFCLLLYVTHNLEYRRTGKVSNICIRFLGLADPSNMG
jgi:hypothetical protein